MARKSSTLVEACPPTRERIRRGEVEALPGAIADSDGRPSQPYRAIDTLMAMERRGTISLAMYHAGEQFRDDFALAAFAPLRCSDMERVARSTGGHRLSGSQIDARERIWTALVALGGLASPSGSCTWHVVGHQESLRDWAMREGWCGRPIHPQAASGILIGSLGVLQAHYGSQRSAGMRADFGGNE